MCCSPDPNTPCFQFVRLGDTYTVTLLHRFSIENLQPLQEPYPNFTMNPSCGFGLDIDTGDVIALNAEKRGPQEHEYSCFAVNGRIDSVPNLQLGGEARTHPGNLDFVESRVAVDGGGCEGEWSFGIAAVNERFKSERPELMPTRYMAYRNFFPRPDNEACAAMFSFPMGCKDQWFMAMTDQSGVVIDR